MAQALNSAGLSIRLPFQLPCLLAAMRAVREVGLHRSGREHLAARHHAPDPRGATAWRPPSGSATGRCSWCEHAPPGGRATATRRRRSCASSAITTTCMASWARRRRPIPPTARGCTSARRASGPTSWPTAVPPMTPGLRYNHVTAAAALPVLLALLPDSEAAALVDAGAVRSLRAGIPCASSPRAPSRVRPPAGRRPGPTRLAVLASASRPGRRCRPCRRRRHGPLHRDGQGGDGAVRAGSDGTVAGGRRRDRQASTTHLRAAGRAARVLSHWRAPPGSAPREGPGK